MIIDTLSMAARYVVLHPLFAPAFDFLATTDLATLPPGKTSLDGDRLYVSIDEVEGRGRAGARLEAHRRYADIQVTIAGTEIIGWRPLAHCLAPDGPFEPARDIGFFTDAPETWLVVPENHFVILFPDDAHAPLAAEGMLKKAIVKVEI
jgi:YhcH/YjgK/YiaL family protein